MIDLISKVSCFEISLSIEEADAVPVVLKINESSSFADNPALTE
jgi:hypothetical protein